MECMDVPFCSRLLWGFLTREGMREGEALALTWGDLDLKRGAVRLDKNKTDDPRSWPLDPSTAEALRRYRKLRSEPASTALVLVDPQGSAHSKFGLALLLRGHLEAVGLKKETRSLSDDGRAPADTRARPSRHVRHGVARERKVGVVDRGPHWAPFERDDQPLQAHLAHVRRARSRRTCSTARCHSRTRGPPAGANGGPQGGPRNHDPASKTGVPSALQVRTFEPRSSSSSPRRENGATRRQSTENHCPFPACGRMAGVARPRDRREARGASKVRRSVCWAGEPGARFVKAAPRDPRGHCRAAARALSSPFLGTRGARDRHIGGRRAARALRAGRGRTESGVIPWASAKAHSTRNTNSATRRSRRSRATSATSVRSRGGLHRRRARRGASASMAAILSRSPIGASSLRSATSSRRAAGSGTASHGTRRRPRGLATAVSASQCEFMARATRGPSAEATTRHDHVATGAVRRHGRLAMMYPSTVPISLALTNWLGVRATQLDQIAHAHRAVGGAGRGRRYATEQINHAYAVLLSSQFQAFCRDLHSEAVDHIVSSVTPVPMQHVLRVRLLENRFVDRGNPTPGNLGSDFGRLGLILWDALYADDARNAERRASLEELNAWRNAIAHQDFDPARVGTEGLRLARVNGWRQRCSNLAGCLDRVLRDHVATLAGSSPW